MEAGDRRRRRVLGLLLVHGLLLLGGWVLPVWPAGRFCGEVVTLMYPRIDVGHTSMKTIQESFSLVCQESELRAVLW
jgi:hypothetical protein